MGQRPFYIRVQNDNIGVGSHATSTVVTTTNTINNHQRFYSQLSESTFVQVAISQEFFITSIRFMLFSKSYMIYKYIVGRQIFS